MQPCCSCRFCRKRATEQRKWSAASRMITFLAERRVPRNSSKGPSSGLSATFSQSLRPREKAPDGYAFSRERSEWEKVPDRADEALQWLIRYWLHYK